MKQFVQALDDRLRFTVYRRGVVFCDWNPELRPCDGTRVEREHR
jgi:hypothetical protein